MGSKEPTGVAVDAAGAVFVSDRKSGDIFKINGQVQPVASGLKRPVGLSFDSSGRLLVVEEGMGRLLRLENSGSLTVVAQGIKKPRWVAVAEDGAIYLTAGNGVGNAEMGSGNGVRSCNQATLLIMPGHVSAPALRVSRSGLSSHLPW